MSPTMKTSVNSIFNQRSNTVEKARSRADSNVVNVCPRGAALVLVMDADAVPIVAEGMVPPAPFSAIATLERAAKPTEGGLYRKTEYTFFRKASPIIQEGAPEPVFVSKNAPMHSVEPELTCMREKSVGLIDQVDPPKDSSTFTIVEHGKL